MPAKIRVHHIQSTHWDREWYQYFQGFRKRLVYLMDMLLEILETDPEFTFYHLDGQTIVLEDYLEIRPERRQALERFIREGRLMVGPWYVMPDEFLVDGESLIRNLMRGHRIAFEFGAEAMKAGYICDIFGHGSQTPQILGGFGIDCATFGRGLSDGTAPAVFWWESPDGTRALSLLLPPSVVYCGPIWGSAPRSLDKRSPKDLPAEVVQGYASHMKAEAERQGLPSIFIIDGGDHALPEALAPELMRRISKENPKFEPLISRMADYFAEVRLMKRELPVLKGEFRTPAKESQPGGTALIAEVLSSRVHLKQANVACEQALLRWAEPMAALAEAFSPSGHKGFLNLAWKCLLRNHPHDSICGCSIDQVHKDMEYRYDQCRLLAREVTRDSLNVLGSRVCVPHGPEGSFPILVWNPAEVEAQGVHEIIVDFPADFPTKYADPFGYEQVLSFKLLDAKGAEVPYERLSQEPGGIESDYAPGQKPFGGGVTRVRLAIQKTLPATGYAALRVVPSAKPTRDSRGQPLQAHEMDNGIIRVDVSTNGTFAVLGDELPYFDDLGIFESCAEIGDGWFHGRPINDEVCTSYGGSVTVTKISRGELQQSLRIGAELVVPRAMDFQKMARSAEKVVVPIATTLTIRAGSPVVWMRVEVDNCACDHRLSMLFPAALEPGAVAWFDSPFDVVPRPMALRDTRDWVEPEVETRPLRSFCGAHDGEQGLYLCTAGLHECAIRETEQTIAVTLFRAFQKTVGTAGEPGGQQLGPMAFEMALVPVLGEPSFAGLTRIARQLSSPVKVTKPRANWFEGAEKVLPAEHSFLRVSNPDLVVSCLKEAEEGAGLILRLHNLRDKAVAGEVVFGFPVRSAVPVNMNEEAAGKPKSVKGNQMTVRLKAKQIATFRLLA